MLRNRPDGPGRHVIVHALLTWLEIDASPAVELMTHHVTPARVIVGCALVLLAAATMKVRADWDGSFQAASAQQAPPAPRPAPQPPAVQAPAATASSDLAVVQKYCVTC